MYDLGSHFHIDVNKGKTPTSCVFRGNYYRISILSDSLIRFEYNLKGVFNDYPTLFAFNRSFGEPKVTVTEDNQNIVIKSSKFILEYQKEKPFTGDKLVPDRYLKVRIPESEKSWYFNHPEVRNFGGTSYSLDYMKNPPLLEKGLFSLDGFATFDDSMTPILDDNGNVTLPNPDVIDTYLFIYNGNFGVGLRDYFNLTSLPPLIPRYALGVWWAKNEEYDEEGIQSLVENFKRNEIPMSILLLNKYARNKNKFSDLSFSFDKSIFPDPSAMSKYLHDNNIYLGCNIRTDGVLSIEEPNHSEFIKTYDQDTDKNIPINVYNSKLIDGFLKGIINPFLNQGVDMLWMDDNNINDRLRNSVMAYYLYNNFNNNIAKRNLLMSRNYGICPHRYSVLYSGNTYINWKTIKYLPFYNSTASNIGVSWWSHDIGGFKGGVEDAELYMRYIQLGTYSPILRITSEGGKYYKREPWKWDVKTETIVKYYLNLRHRLIPYLYAEAKKYSSIGSPLIQPLYYKYPETYDEPLYKNEYYFGTELFVCPIVSPKNEVMDRVVHRIFLPNGVWYDFKTGKKFMGGKRYVTFYKDEDYPVFAKTGAIIPMAVLDKENLNDTSSPKTLQIDIFPGRSNTYKLYEDDGYSLHYKQGESFTTEINYYYKENDFSVSLEPVEGSDASSVPETRNYVINFRNTKPTNGVQVFVNEINIPFESHSVENDFIVEFNNVKLTDKVLIFCKGKDIEIDSSRAINEDLDGIISDLKVDTEIKVKLADILFSDSDIKAKRIAIRKLKRDGLEPVFIKMFMKLLEYIAEL